MGYSGWIEHYGSIVCSLLLHSHVPFSLLPLFPSLSAFCSCFSLRLPPPFSLLDPSSLPSHSHLPSSLDLLSSTHTHPPRELISSHPANLGTVLTCVVNNELGQCRSHSNMALISMMLYTWPDETAKVRIQLYMYTCIIMTVETVIGIATEYKC